MAARPRFAWWPAAGLVALAGCGVADYEARMLEAQARAARFDEEQLLLDDPLVVPSRRVEDPQTKQVQEVPLADLFLRPPKGIGPRHVASAGETVLHSYPIAPGSFAAGVGLLDYRLGLATVAEPKDAEAFLKSVQNHRSLPRTPPKTRSQTLGTGSRAVTYQVAEYDADREGVAVYQHQAGGTLVVVAVRYRKDQLRTLQPALDRGLEGLALDGRAVRARAEHARRPKSTAAPPAPTKTG